MPWFKIDDKHHDHTKTRKALRGVKGKRRDAGAMGLWELAGSWSADNLMDGFVPTDELFRWDDDWASLADRLVAAGYWESAERDGEEGFQFINWDEHQPTKADVESKREAARERMRNIRSGASNVRANKERTSGEVRDPRPVPSRPERTSSSTDVDGDFNAWWATYPRKVGKGQAAKAYKAARKKTDADTLLAAIAAQTSTLTKDGKEFCPHASTWLNGERWLDEGLATATQAAAAAPRLVARQCDSPEPHPGHRWEWYRNHFNCQGVQP